jgi:hypothetical protein
MQSTDAANPAKVPNPPTNGMLTLISGGEFCARRGISRGSECDSLDDSAIHLLLLDSARKPLACGRLHFNALDEAQVKI